MRVSVVCFGPLRDHLPPDAEGNEATIEASMGDDVAAVAARLAISPRSTYAVMINDEPASLTTPVEDGDRVTLMPPFSGGAGGRLPLP